MRDIKKCPHCGKDLHAGAQYCMYCMTSFKPKQDITPNLPGRKKWVIIAVILLILGILVFGLFYVAKSGLLGDNVSNQETTVVQTSPTEQMAATADSSATQETVTEESNQNTLPTETTQIDAEKIPYVPAIQPDSGYRQESEDTRPTIGASENMTTTQQLACSHVFYAANCLSPMTCSKCGITVGSPDLTNHTWKAIKNMIRHEQTGHYEDVEYSYKKTVYLCFFCGYDQDGFDSLELVREHMPEHAKESMYDYAMGRADLLTEVREVWVMDTKQQWIVDSEAYDETVIVAYACERCGMQKEP